MLYVKFEEEQFKIILLNSFSRITNLSLILIIIQPVLNSHTKYGVLFLIFWNLLILIVDRTTRIQSFEVFAISRSETDGACGISFANQFSFTVIIHRPFPIYLHILVIYSITICFFVPTQFRICRFIDKTSTPIKLRCNAESWFEFAK